MRSPLTVRISDGVRDQQVTRFAKGLRFTKTAPGGHHSASVTIDAPEGLFADLGPADRIFIYDGRNARTVWDGDVENPGRQTVAGGARYDLSAMGGQVLASDNARAVVFRHKDLVGAQWQRYANTLESAVTGLDTALIPDKPALKTMFQPGTPVGGVTASMTNSVLQSTGQWVRSATVTIRGGKAADDYFTDFGVVDLALMLEESVGAVALTTADATVTITPTVADWETAGGTPATVWIQISHAIPETNVTDNLSWAAFYDFILTPTLVNTSGVDAAPAATVSVLASEVAAHVVGAMLPQIDGGAALMTATTFGIDNLAYLDGAKPHQILDDLALYEPDFLWEILESGSNGKHRFAYRAWPTTPRYEISGREFTESGGEADLCNRVVVSWKDATGAEQTTIRTATVDALGSRTKDADPITLPDGQGSQANAERIGDEILAALNTPSRSGTAVIRERILDRLSGLMVMPWEIEPGYLVRVRDIGVDLRLTEMTYEDENCTASLKLGTPTLSLAQRIARLR